MFPTVIALDRLQIKFLLSSDSLFVAFNFFFGRMMVSYWKLAHMNGVFKNILEILDILAAFWATFAPVIIMYKCKGLNWKQSLLRFHNLV